MPQLYSKAPSKGALSIGAGSAMARPSQAVGATAVVASYSMLETQLTRLFVAMSGSNSRAATAVFGEVRNQKFQRDALQAVADNVFQADQEFRDLVAASLDLASRAAGPRNRVAHWVWAHDDTLQDVLLLIDPRALTNFHVETNEWRLSLPIGKKIDKIPDMPSLDHDRVWMYDLKDFQSAINNIEEASGVIFLLEMIASVRRPELDAQLRPQLLEQPAIAKALERLRKDRQSDP